MSFKVEGIKELEKALVELGSRAGKKALLGALRDAAKPVRKAARQLAPKKTGNLRKSIKTKAVAGKGKTANVATVMTGTFREKRAKYDAYYAHMVEFGTKKHRIPSKTVGRGRLKRNNKARVRIGDKVFSNVIHPGTKAKPFIKPAFDKTHRQALQILSKRLKERIILEAIKKHGRKFH